MTKKAQMDLCKTILHKYGVGEEVVGDDLISLYLVFENHNHWEEKKGVGIKYISTMKTGYGNKCFVLIRNDNSKTDISYMSCITGKNKQSEIKSACRNAIRPIITDMKNRINYGIDLCEITGEILTKENTHIDHYDKTFTEIYSEWSKGYTEDYLFDKVSKGNDMDTITKFYDQAVIDSFVAFHNKNTHLRAVTAEANLSLIKRIGK